MLLEAKISTKRGTWSQALIPQPGELMSHSVGSDNNHINTRLCEYYRIEIENLATPCVSDTTNHLLLLRFSWYSGGGNIVQCCDNTIT